MKFEHLYLFASIAMAIAAILILFARNYLVAMLLYCVKRFSEIFRRPMLIPSTDVFQSRCH